MSIIYYPNRVQKKKSPAIDNIMSKRTLKKVSGVANVLSNATSVIINNDSDWQIDSIKLYFSNTVSKDYNASIVGGINIIENLNDYLWFKSPNTLWQKITLDAGFYEGSTIITELESKLDANESFIDLGITFTVTYDFTTGLFTITPSSGTIQYLQTNNAITHRYRDSIAGHLFGFTETTDFLSSISSDTPVFGLGNATWIIDETDSTDEESYFDDIKILDIDQALVLTANSASNILMYYDVVYEGIN